MNESKGFLLGIITFGAKLTLFYKTQSEFHSEMMHLEAVKMIVGILVLINLYSRSPKKMHLRGDYIKNLQKIGNIVEK